jgi:long-chain acyl-CoA synthetase
MGTGLYFALVATAGQVLTIPERAAGYLAPGSLAGRFLSGSSGRGAASPTSAFLEEHGMARTLIRLFLDTVATWHKPAQFLRRGEHGWEAISADRALADIETLGLGLRHLGLRAGDHVALLSENRYEWAIADLALVGLGAVTVPVYPTLTAEQCRFIFQHAEVRGVIVSTAEQVAKIRAVQRELPRLEFIVPMEPLATESAREKSWNLVTGRGALARSSDPLLFRAETDLVKPEDLATIIYTSGTTGEPKGALLSHANICSNVEASLQVVSLRPTDTILSFLPLSHIFERMAGFYTMLAAGVTIAYARSMDTVAQDAAEVHPTILTGVPRFFEKVRSRVIENARARSLLSRAIFSWALGQGLRKARAHLARRSVFAPLAPLADLLVAAKVRARMGGRLRLCFSGGAPLHPMVLEFFLAMGIPVIEGYGLTETSPVICLNPPGREKAGTVGPPLPGVEVEIGEEGEILTRGPHVMQGYWRNREGTEQAMRGNWFRTGDVGFLDEEGYLHITDRLKDLLVTAGGKNVAPQPLENRLKGSRWITEAVVLGDRRPYVVALLVPSFERLESLARRQNWPFADRQELLARPEILGIYQRRVDRLNSTLAPFEQIKRFALLDQELTHESGELTLTLKVRRRVFYERHADLIEKLYTSPQGPVDA